MRICREKGRVGQEGGRRGRWREREVEREEGGARKEREGMNASQLT